MASAAERMALMRDRRAKGEVVVTLLIGQSVTSPLVERGLLDADETTDANAVTMAVCRHLRGTLIRASA